MRRAITLSGPLPASDTAASLLAKHLNAATVHVLVCEQTNATPVDIRVVDAQNVLLASGGVVATWKELDLIANVSSVKMTCIRPGAPETVVYDFPLASARKMVEVNIGGCGRVGVGDSITLQWFQDDNKLVTIT